MLIFFSFYLMFATGTFIAMFTSDKEFDFGQMVMNTLFWPVFWSALICCDLMDK
jgi:hypothetical protein